MGSCNFGLQQRRRMTTACDCDAFCWSSSCCCGPACGQPVGQPVDSLWPAYGQPVVGKRACMDTWCLRLSGVQHACRRMVFPRLLGTQSHDQSASVGHGQCRSYQAMCVLHHQRQLKQQPRQFRAQLPPMHHHLTSNEGRCRIGRPSLTSTTCIPTPHRLLPKWL